MVQFLAPETDIMGERIYIILMNRCHKHFNLLLKKNNPIIAKDETIGSHPLRISMIDNPADKLLWSSFMSQTI